MTFRIPDSSGDAAPVIVSISDALDAAQFYAFLEKHPREVERAIARVLREGVRP